MLRIYDLQQPTGEVCPVIQRALKERSAEMKRKGAQIVGSMVMLIKDGYRLLASFARFPKTQGACVDKLKPAESLQIFAE